MNVLYMGMADDILAPLLLVPELTTLFAIDKFDKCFSKDKTWKGQKEDIKQILLNGSDIDSHSRQIDIECGNDKDIYYLVAKSFIIEDKDTGYVWRLKFKYNNIERQLVYYHHRDFLIKWPDDIKDISHVMYMGAFRWDYFNLRSSYILISMLETRTLVPYYIYGATFCHKHFPEHLMIGAHSAEDGGISRIQVSDMTTHKWIEQIYRPADMEYSEDSNNESSDNDCSDDMEYSENSDNDSSNDCDDE
jgi:hypothetical protein